MAKAMRYVTCIGCNGYIPEINAIVKFEVEAPKYSMKWAGKPICPTCRDEIIKHAGVVLD